MKKTITLLLLLLCTLSYSQTINTIWGDGDEENGRATDMVINGNDLYVGIQFQNKIIKLDLTNPTSPIATNVITGLELDPSGLIIRGDFLYFSSIYGNTISKINLTENEPDVEIIVSGLTRPSSLTFRNNELYIAHGPAQFNSSGKISKINVDEENPAVIDVLTGLMRPEKVIYHDNYLFFAQFDDNNNGGGGKIFKLDLLDSSATPIELISGLTKVTSFTIHNNELFIGSFLTNPPIIKIDLTSGSNETTTVINNGIDVSDLTNDGSYLYITDTDVLSIPIDYGQLSLNEYSFDRRIKLYPNPSEDVLHFSNLPKERNNYTIIDNFGCIVLNGHLSSNEIINISSFSTGIYLIKFENRPAIKFIKE